MKKNILFFTLLFSVNVKANMWGLCPGMPVTGMIPCDTSCFGPAGTNLGSTYVNSEGQLQEALANNANNWVSMNNTYLEYLSNYYERVNLNNSNRATALDGVAKSIAIALDLFSEVQTRSTDHFVNSYQQIQTELRTADLVKENTLNLNPSEGAPTGTFLLSHIDDFANSYHHQKALDSINDYVSNRADAINSTQQGLLLAQANHKADSELSIYDLPQQILDGTLTDEEWLETLQSIAALYTKLKSSDDIESKRLNIRNQLALNMLSKSFKLRNNGEEAAFDLEEHIQSLNLKNYLSGENTRAYKHTLKQEIVYQQSIQNSLLHSYLEQKKANNALKIIDSY